ncbi:MAG: hypothetical protein HC786_32945, partial [Richelia sp. CSU_2_1]|nr:hypothetical protein [Richelia sp. CSU_2_1]
RLWQNLGVGQRRLKRGRDRHWHTLHHFLQILFSQWGAMNVLFDTAPLTFNQFLICLIPVMPMVVLAALIDRLDPANS